MLDIEFVFTFKFITFLHLSVSKASAICMIPSSLIKFFDMSKLPKFGFSYIILPITSAVIDPIPAPEITNFRYLHNLTRFK